MRRRNMSKNCYRKIYIVICIAVCVLMCSGCSLRQKYYSKRKVKRFAKELVSDDVKYIKYEKIEGKKVFHFEDSNGRLFFIVASSGHIQLVNSSIPLYTPGITDTYQFDIYQYEKDRIQKILDDTKLQWQEVLFSSYENTEQMDEIQEALYGNCGVVIDVEAVQKEDLKVLAQALSEIDQILEYNYDRDMKTWLQFNKQPLSIMHIVFDGLGSGFEYGKVAIPFSTSEENRWTEDSMYDYLLERYAMYEKEVELRDEIPQSAIAYLEEKYKKEFIYDEETGVRGSLFYIDKVSEVRIAVYEKDDTKKEFRITVTVSVPPMGDGKYIYTDDYESVREIGMPYSR